MAASSNTQAYNRNALARMSASLDRMEEMAADILLTLRTLTPQAAPLHSTHISCVSTPSHLMSPPAPPLPFSHPHYKVNPPLAKISNPRSSSIPSRIDSILIQQPHSNESPPKQPATPTPPLHFIPAPLPASLPISSTPSRNDSTPPTKHSSPAASLIPTPQPTTHHPIAPLHQAPPFQQVPAAPLHHCTKQLILNNEPAPVHPISPPTPLSFNHPPSKVTPPPAPPWKSGHSNETPPATPLQRANPYPFNACIVLCPQPGAQHKPQQPLTLCISSMDSVLREVQTAPSIYMLMIKTSVLLSAESPEADQFLFHEFGLVNREEIPPKPPPTERVPATRYNKKKMHPHI